MSDSTNFNIGIVVPCYNEANRISIPTFEQDIIKYKNHFYCFVNDGSSDNTLAILQEFAEKFPSQIEVLNNPHNMGKAETVRNGINFLHAKNNFDIRWFTPVSEAPICVHATLASAHVLYQNKIIEKNTEINFFNSNNKFIASEMNGWISLNFPSINITEMKSSKVIDEILKNQIPLRHVFLRLIDA
jgi:glycosyltransferase involved in cell wall biosynthesis